jgi:hypothetical protein
MGLSRIKKITQGLSLDQLRRLNKSLHDLIRQVEENQRKKRLRSRKQVIDGRATAKKTFRLQGVRCGKERCKCIGGTLHGPYWYSYTRVKDKLTSQYIGKKLPKDIEKKLKSLKERKA